jgi:hypothetical protein
VPVKQPILCRSAAADSERLLSEVWLIERKAQALG